MLFSTTIPVASDLQETGFRRLTERALTFQQESEVVAMRPLTMPSLLVHATPDLHDRLILHMEGIVVAAPLFANTCVPGKSIFKKQMINLAMTDSLQVINHTWHCFGAGLSKYLHSTCLFLKFEALQIELSEH